MHDSLTKHAAQLARLDLLAAYRRGEARSRQCPLWAALGDAQ
jgi:hypothetical protein